MKEIKLMDRMPADVLSRQDILHAMQKIDVCFEETQLRYLMEKLQKSGSIVRVGHNQYRGKKETEVKCEYSNLYSETAIKVIAQMEERFPLLDFRIWEFSWLNEFFNHQIAHNKIFLEVENEGCEFTYSTLSEEYKSQLLLKPTIEELLRYGVDDGIIIDRLVTESPKGQPERYNVSLEKLIVDLFANKELQSIISKGDYPMAIDDMFAKYQINQVKMFRYAKRRNKVKVLYHFLKEKTNIEVLVEG